MQGRHQKGDKGTCPPPTFKIYTFCIIYDYYISAIYSLCSIIISNIDLYYATQYKSIILSPQVNFRVIFLAKYMVIIDESEIDLPPPLLITL